MKHYGDVSKINGAEVEQLESYLIDQKRVYIITAKRNDEKSKEMYFRGKVDALSEVQLFIEKLTEEEE